MRMGFRMGTISAKDVVAKRQVGLDQLAPAAGTIASREESDEMLVAALGGSAKVFGGRAGGTRSGAWWRWPGGCARSSRTT